MDAFIIIGNSHTRKASLVRSLSGCFNRSVRDILPSGARVPFRLYARVGALQETRTSPEGFVTEAERTRCGAVLCCLAPSAHPHEPGAFPDARHYLDHFMAAGWRVAAIVVLGQNGGGIRSPRLLQLPQSSTAPINLTAHSVRAHFGWE